MKLEFVTVEAGEDGRIQTLIPDKGEVLTVSEDRTGSTISPNTSRRVMSNYEVLSGENTATIYSLQSLITPVPKPEDDPVYKDGIKLDPVEMVSIWLGRDYLNMILNLKISTGKGHVFGIVEGIHAGLECGLFASKLEGLDAVSIGPQMHHIHTTEERLSISSTLRTWNLIVRTLELLK